MDNDNLALIFLKLSPLKIVELKFTLESYEGIGIIRTLNKNIAEVVIIATKDSLSIVNDVLDSLKQELDFTVIPPPASINDDWLLAENIE